MPKCCIICSAVASPDIMLQYCAQCQSALYCSRACQRIDWREKQHKKICKLLNVGHGDRQVRIEGHTSRYITLREDFATTEGRLDEGEKRFFKLFQESTFEGSRAAAQKMKKYAKRQTKYNQEFLYSHSLGVIVFADNKKLSWPNSPLLVMLQLVDPNMMFGDGELRMTLLHRLADLAAPNNFSTHQNQVILAKQLVEHGADVSAVSIPQGMMPLHRACCAGNVTNLDFVEYLLDAGADPNARDRAGNTPLMYTTPDAPGAAKFLLNWPTTDVNITSRSGKPFLVWVRDAVKYFSDKLALPDNPETVQHQFAIQQWCEIEEMLVEREDTDTRIAPLE
jgi:hypothetical protein